MSASLGYEHARTGSAASLPPTRVPVVWGQRDALFEILDAVLSAPSLETPAHLSLTPTCQRGWGSLYDALNAGTMNLTRLETLVASYPVDPPHAQTAWYAVDASVWPRCDAETSPDRGYYHHPYRHSHGQPIVAGWNYSWLVQLPRRCSSWTAPLRVRRIIPGANSNLIAAEHMRSWLGQAPPAPPLPIFTFDAGDDPVHLSLALDDLPVCLLVRLRAGRCFSADPTSQPQTGRPRRHGAKFVCDDPTTWPTPSSGGQPLIRDMERSVSKRGVGCTPPTAAGAGNPHSPRSRPPAASDQTAAAALVLVVRADPSRFGRRLAGLSRPLLH